MTHYSMSIEDAYRQKKAAQLKEWGAQIDLFEARAENAGADIVIMRAKELETLRARHKAASQKMQDLETATGQAWEQVKETADKIWDELKDGVAEARAKFK